MEVEQRKFYEQQINRYKKLRPLYKKYTKLIEKFINNLIKGCSSEYVIQARTKSISSFARKLFKLEIEYINPLNEIEDLCGIRIILPNIHELLAVCDIIKNNFFIKFEKSDIEGEQVETDSSIEHSQKYIIQLIPDLKLYERLNLDIQKEFYDFKAEVKVHTFLSHGWAANQYKIFNQYEFKIPKAYKQEFSRVKSLVSIEDEVLNDLMLKMRDYESNYGAYMSTDQIRAEIERLTMAYDADKEDYKMGYRIARLAMAINDMDKSIEILNEIIKSNKYNRKASELEIASILRDLGISHHIKFKKDPNSKEFLLGQSYLKEAVQRNDLDSDAWASLGGTYKEQENYEKALECYSQALNANPGDPYPLGNYLVIVLQQTGDLIHIEKNREMIQKGIEKRLKQIEVMVDIPWAFFDVGLFYLFLANIYEALDYYLKGIKYSPDIWMIETTLKTINNLKIIQDKLEGIDLVKQILHLGILFHPNLKEKTDKILRESTKILNADIEEKHSFSDENIVIIAGGTDERIEGDLILYKNILIEAFQDFKGTIISGGTKSGISGIVGDIQEAYPLNIKTVGYVPMHFPAHIEIDKRYSAIHTTKGKDFSFIEPIQYWYDIMKSGIESNRVKLIGINGGKISAFEFHAAIVFGAQIGIMESSGRAAFDLINDPSWEEPLGKEHDYATKKLFKVLKNTSEDIYNFLTKPFIIDPDISNIQKLLIQHKSSGIDMYEFSFSLEDVDNTLFSGFLNALDSIATQTLNVGDILSIKFREGYLTGGFFNNGEFKVVFLLNEIPSKSLENKIVKYIKKVEKRMGDTFHRLRLSCQSYSGGEEMNNILSKVFGSEILKLIGNVAEK